MPPPVTNDADMAELSVPPPPERTGQRWPPPPHPPRAWSRGGGAVGSETALKALGGVGWGFRFCRALIERRKMMAGEAYSQSGSERAGPLTRGTLGDDGQLGRRRTRADQVGRAGRRRSGRRHVRPGLDQREARRQAADVQVQCESPHPRAVPDGAGKARGRR